MICGDRIRVTEIIIISCTIIKIIKMRENVGICDGGGRGCGESFSIRNWILGRCVLG